MTTTAIGSPKNGDPEPRLIQQARAGDRRAFDDLVRRHQDRIFNVCFWYLNDYQEADDAAQEVFIKLFQSLKTFRGESSLATWLYRITMNTCKNKSKSADFRFRRRSRSIDQQENGQRNPEIPDHAPNPGQQLDSRETVRMVQKAIHSLTEKKRTVILLRDIEGCAYEEIAAITGLKLGTVRSALARARAEVKQKLIQVGGHALQTE